MQTDWFSRLFGFREELSNGSIWTNLSVTEAEGCQSLESSVNGQKYCIGRFEHVSLEELESRPLECSNVKSTMSIISGDVGKLFLDPANNGAIFQVASQFNCLEFINSNVVPEDGVTGYERDHTQGPICSIICGPATVYRNYFLPMTKEDGSVQAGQSRDLQLDGMEDISAILGNSSNQYYTCRNGYLTCTSEQLTACNSRLDLYCQEHSQLSRKDVLEKLGNKLKIGIHYNVEVTSSKWGKVLTNSPQQQVTQVFGAACAMGYSRCTKNALWADLSNLVLIASYDALLRVAAGSENKKVFLTFIGGGVFQNPMHWILGAIEKAAKKYKDHGLEIYLVCYGGPSPSHNKLVDDFKKFQM